MDNDKNGIRRKNMKKTLIGGLCASTLIGITACQTTMEKDPQQNKLATEIAVKESLVSGVNIENFDKSIRPQDDFYHYVNGNWIKNNSIPDDRTRIGSFYDLRDQAKKDVKAIIDRVANKKDLEIGSDEQKIADLYHAFMDEEKLNALGISPLTEELAKIDDITNKSQLVSYFAHSQTIGASSPLAFYVSVDAKNSNNYATHIWQSGLGLPEKDYYFNQAPRFIKIRQSYLVHIANMFTLAGFSEPQKSAQHIMSLESAIADVQWDVVETRNSSKRYNKYQVQRLRYLTPHIDWKQYLISIGASDQTYMIINQPSFVAGLGKLVADKSLTEWKTYLKWQLLTHYAPYLGKPFEKENFAFFNTILNGQQQQEPRWKRGVDSVNNMLGEIIGKQYVNEHFSPEAKERMSILVENLRSAYGVSIDNLEWMSAKTKIAAKEKLAKFTPKIGYPDRWKDYSQLIIKSDDLVGNAMRANQIFHQQDLNKLGGKIQKWEWFMTPQTVNAYFNPTMNEIVFPAAILQPPFFNMAADDAVNYGGIGAVIGHEMGHGFDDQGAKFDGDGNLVNWWTKEDLTAFQIKCAALIKQYDNYPVFDDLNINGKLTLGENIGDLAGVTIAYKAYKMSLNGKKAPVINGFTGDERFFIGFTQIWRVKTKEETLRNQVATSPHSPSQYRAIGPLSNMPEFYQTYRVQKGDAMFLPEKNRVKIW